MKRFYTVVLFIIVFIAETYSQNPASKADTVFLEINNLTQKWYAAIKNRDSLSLENILAKDYTVNGTWPRDKWMDNIMHHFKMDSFEIAAPAKLTYFGNAVLSEGLLYWKGSNDGNPFMNAEFIVNDIWVYKNERWQVHMRLLKFSKNR